MTLGLESDYPKAVASVNYSKIALANKLGTERNQTPLQLRESRSGQRGFRGPLTKAGLHRRGIDTL
jgi:hypothetical protein